MRKLKRIKTLQTLQEAPVVRYSTDKEHGLSEEQIAERLEHRLVNDTKIKTSNSYFSIICKNTFTVFNIIWLFIAIALMCVNAWGDLLFLFVVIANTAISIFQEIKAKITVEKLSMVTAPKIRVIRTSLEMEVHGEDLLLDDIIILENGNQIPADCIIVDGVVEANESLLTGESNSIKKVAGDTLLAGSFLVSGKCYARVDKVGKNNYIQTVAERTKDFKPQTSNLFKDLNNLIKIIIIILIPIGVLTYFKEMMIGSTIEEAITSTSGALTGMIPAGMYLLITVGLTVGVLKLARKKTLVKNLYSIEMLARANVLCLDKTGTITDGTMKVREVCPQASAKKDTVTEIMKTILAHQSTMNATSIALVEHFGKENNDKVANVVEFSSQRKFSATTLKDGKTYYVGAISFIKCAVSAEQKKLINSYMEQGLRVVGLVEDANPYSEKMVGKKGTLLAIIALEDHIRKDAIETIKWFKDNNVEIKIISGDDAVTVSKIAKRVGVENSDKYISLENMSLQEVAQIAGNFTVFGRVTPEQKHTIIKTLKTQGNVVAMTGDGVNDTLALKEANCSIAMADGSEVARNISHLVLMESNFSALPSIVKEGRQIVNNVQHSSVLYLMKTIFTILLCVTTLILGISYPFTPKQLLLLEMFIIGLPSFILTFQPNNELIRGNFIPQVLKKTIPCALLLFVNVLIVVVLHKNNPNILTEEEFKSLSTLLLTCVGFVNLVWVCWPLNWLRTICICISAILIISVLSGLGNFFTVSAVTFPVIVTLLTLLLCTILVVVGIFYLKEWYVRKQAAQTNGEVARTTLWDMLVTKVKTFGKKRTSNPAELETSQEVQISNIDENQPELIAQEKPTKRKKKDLAKTEASQNASVQATAEQSLTNSEQKTSSKRDKKSTKTENSVEKEQHSTSNNAARKRTTAKKTEPEKQAPKAESGSKSGQTKSKKTTKTN